MAQDPVIYVTEPNDGTNVTVSSCFQANVTRPRRRAAMFVLTFLNTSTAYQGLDFIVERALYIAIPAGFSGVFTECVNISILGDNIIEGDEVIEYSVMPMSDRDLVDISGPLRVNILDNDGMYLRVMHDPARNSLMALLQAYGSPALSHAWKQTKFAHRYLQLHAMDINL
jgi:hypothetical protein